MTKRANIQNEHKKDPRMIVSAGNDGFVRIINSETSEILGATQLQQNDKVRAITWCSASRPDLFAIQYFQHPTEFESIESGSERSNVRRTDVALVPAWVSAAPVGASFAKGGRMATHYRQWDEAKQIWHYTVEVRQLPVKEELYQSAMELQNAQDANSFGSYCEDRAHATNDRNLQILWTFLAALSNKQGRQEYVKILGFGKNERMSPDTRASRRSTASHEVTQLTDLMSSMNYASHKENGEDAHSVSDDDSSTADDVFARQPDLDWSQLHANAWSMLDSLIENEDEDVVNELLAQKNYEVAFMFARNNSKLMHLVTSAYISEQLAAPQRLLTLIATESFDQLLESFPREQWSRLLALVVARVDRTRLAHIMRKVATKWIALGGEESVHAAFAAVLAHDVGLLLKANRSYPLDERIRQALVLRSLTGDAGDEEFEQLLCTYCENLIAGGVSDAAWRLLSNLNTKNERLLSLRHDLFVICGGEQRTMKKEPENPRLKHASAINNALHAARSPHRHPVFTPTQVPSSSSSPLGSGQQRPRLDHRNPSDVHSATSLSSASNYSGYPPVPSIPSTGYPPVPSVPGGYPPVPSIPGGYPPVPAPPLPAAMPSTMFAPPQPPLPPPVAPPGHQVIPSNGYVHTQPGFNPPIPTSMMPPPATQYMDGKSHGWNDPPPLAARKATPPVAPVFEVNWKPLEPAPVTLPNALPGVVSGVPQRPQSSTSQHQPETREIPQVTLTPEDQAIMDRLQQLVDAILSVNRSPVALHKIDEAKTRFGCELAPRLASGKLSLTIRQLLWQCTEHSSRGNYREAVVTCGQMVRCGGDFVEVSAFLPALKSLFSLAQSTFSR
ncbi:hypothetical protein Q1695_005869 [Nippostrongylus brasiliensis]|nr:hypothetical protein Q1695_005869 [Nippostrongylus brasiliensis]